MVVVRLENFECVEDLVRVVVTEFPLVKANVGKQCYDVAYCSVKRN